MRRHFHNYIIKQYKATIIVSAVLGQKKNQLENRESLETSLCILRNKICIKKKEERKKTNLA